MLRRQRAIEIVPGSKPLRWRRYDVPQHLAPETGDALRFCAVEGDLDLLDRRHRSTIEAGSFVVSTGPPLARLRRMRPALEDERDLKPWVLTGSRTSVTTLARRSPGSDSRPVPRFRFCRGWLSRRGRAASPTGRRRLGSMPRSWCRRAGCG